MLLAGNDVLGKSENWFKAAEITFTSESRMFNESTAQHRSQYEQTMSTYNVHHLGTTLDLFNQHSNLTSFFKVVTTSLDDDG